MAFHISIGKIGELIAEKYLRSLGCRIIEKNFLRKWGEIDLIVKLPDSTLVFVEVKTMRENKFLVPEDNITNSKLKKIRRTAMLYAGERHDLVNDKKGWRIDVISITLPYALQLGERETLTEFVKHFSDYKINHFENV